MHVRRRVWALALTLGSAIPQAVPTAVAAALPEEPAPTAAQPADRFAAYGQLTYVEQETLGFRAPYRGPNSLIPKQGRETTDLTAYVGARLWSGAELWLNEEIDEGFGLNNTTGAAGFPSGPHLICHVTCRSGARLRPARAQPSRAPNVPL